MDKSHPEAFIQALQQPDPARDAIYRKRLAEEHRLERLRKVAWLALAGALIGAGVAVWWGQRPADGVIWGGLFAAGIGWIINQMTTRRTAS